MVRSANTLILFTIIFGLAFLLTANSAEFVGAARGGAVFVNSPYMITTFHMVLGIFSIFIVPSFMANTLLRDTDSNFAAILYSMPVRKRDFLIGRFVGAFAAMMVAFAAAPLGMLLGSLSPLADPETLGPVHPEHYAFVFLRIFLPSMLVLATFIFAVAVITRRLLFTYVTAFVMLILYLGVSETNIVSPLWDPFMHRVLEEQTRYWTASERNTMLLSYDGIALANRAVWLVIAGALFVLAYKRFSFRSVGKKPKTIKAEKAVPPIYRLGGRLRIAPNWTGATTFHQLLGRTRFEVRAALASLPFVIVLVASILLMGLTMIEREPWYGVDAYPLTRLVVAAIIDSNWWAMLAILVFYSADILWRERDARCHGIMDALPAPNWVFLVAKLTALLLMMYLISIIGVGMGIVLQLLNGDVTIDLGVYLERILFFNLPFIYLAILAFFLQVLAKGRLIGMLLMGLFLLVSIGMNDFLGSEHPLLKYGLAGFASPNSDMNGTGRFATAGYWLRGYWAAIAGLLLIATHVLWNRGTEQPMRYRLRAFRNRNLIRPVFGLIGVLAVTGGFIFYNTNVLNPFYTAKDVEELRVAFEQQYRPFEDLPMPRVIAVETEVDIYPYRGRIETKGSYQLENKTDETLAVIHLMFPRGVEINHVTLEGGVEHSRDETYNYLIFDLATPMPPGQVRTLDFATTLQHKGFRHGSPDLSLVRNGTFITNNRLTPFVGFQPAYMLQDPKDRRAHGLEPLAGASLEDVDQHHRSVNRYDSDFISFRTRVSTVDTQIAVAPGRLRDQWLEKGRAFFDYEMEAPMMHFYAYLSAEYQVLRDKWNDVDIEIYYHPTHTYNLDRMVQGIKDSLTVYSEAFGPYQYPQIRVLEFPAYRSFAQSFANTIPFSEGLGFVSDVGPTDLDVPYYVTAHEVAHQWWGHQVSAADSEGASMLNEAFSQYSALLVMERRYGKHRIRRFLAEELDLYLSGRADDNIGERPLYRVENQEYIHYRKGSLIMYALRDYLGEDLVNRCLRRFVENHAFRSSPYATSKDFLDILKAEAGPQQESLIQDFFEKITLYDLKTEVARVEETPDGRFKVQIDVEVGKYYADALGNEEEAPFDIPVDVGLYTKHPDAAGFGAADVLHFEKQLISGKQATLTVIVDQKPEYAGIDPYHKLIDRNTKDNLIEVTH
jgi:hypothetical protein